MSGEYTLRCDAAHFDAVAGVCSHPYYAMTADSLWSLTPEEGAMWGGVIVGLWSLGLAARVLIRTAEQASKS